MCKGFGEWFNSIICKAYTHLQGGFAMFHYLLTQTFSVVQKILCKDYKDIQAKCLANDCIFVKNVYFGNKRMGY